MRSIDSPQVLERTLSERDVDAGPSEVPPAQTGQALVGVPARAAQNATTDHSSAQVPVHWRLIINGLPSQRNLYEFASDFETVWNGVASASLISTTRNENIRPASMVQITSAEPYRGKRVRYSAQVRTRKIAPEFRASLWLRAQDINGLVVAFQDMNGRMIAGNSEWSEQSIVLDMPQDASVMLYGIFGVNEGTLWIDDVRISTVDQTVALTAAAWSVGNGVINLAIDPNRALLAPANLDFEETETVKEGVYWRERDQPSFRVPSLPH